MSYIGQPYGLGKPTTHTFTATGGETTLTTSDDGRTLTYTPGSVEVFLNGVRLVDGVDYSALDGSSVSGLDALVSGDVVVVVALAVQSVADAVSASAGGEFLGGITVNGVSGLSSGDMPAGSIVQVVQGSTNTVVQNTTTSFVDTDLSATITPKSNANKVLVMITQAVESKRDAFHVLGYRLMRNGSVLADFDRTLGISTGNALRSRIALSYLDSPATTSSVTYKTQGRCEFDGSNAEVTFQVLNDLSTMILLEVAA